MKHSVVLAWVALILGSICGAILLLSIPAAFASFSEWNPFTGFAMIAFLIGPFLAVAAILSGGIALSDSGGSWDHSQRNTVFSWIGIGGGGLLLIGAFVLRCS